MLTEFKQFLFRGNIIDLAVAVVIGTAFVASRSQRWCSSSWSSP
jgi:large-conductance mechanosensitive channel